MVDDGAELGQPSLVVSVESDAIDFGWHNWVSRDDDEVGHRKRAYVGLKREVGLSRAVQITQWTFMARPGHPVFLDALGRTLRKSEEIARKEKEAKKNGKEFIPETAVSVVCSKGLVHANFNRSLSGLAREFCKSIICSRDCIPLTSDIQL